MNTDNLLLILVFIFAQNKQLMEDVKPVLDFLEEHQGAVGVLEQLLKQQKSTDDSAATRSSPAEPAMNPTSDKTETKRNENEKTQSPLQGIANEAILKNIRSYLDNQAR